MDRKLAAILAADVVGYSALMERDEKGTFARLRAHRTELFEPEIEGHHGRVFKLMGDGLLAEFGSVVDAVECAVAVQREMARRNKGVAPDERIDIRIGINLGDVIVEGLDRHGEGVNIAARLEQLADPGGICVSQTVVDHLGNKLPIGIEAMGEHQVKNIVRPVKAYRVRFDGTRAVPAIAAPATRPLRVRHAAGAGVALFLVVLGALAWLRPWTPATEPATVTGPAVTDTRPSLVVLPFDSLSDDKEQAYLADGITEDLTTALARIPGLFVISRNSAFTYKGKTIQPAQVAKDLGVRYILEGSIRRAGADMRINAQLIDATTGGHMWAERFDGAWGDVFKLQDQVVSQVASALKLRLVAGPRMAESPGGSDNPAAYDLLLRGYELNYATSPVEAAALYRQAVALDPNFGQAWAELAWVYWSAAGNDEAQKAIGTSTYVETVSKIKEFLKESEKHPSSTYYQLMADLFIWQRKSDDAIIAAERAIALDPSNHWSYEQMSLALAYNGRAADAKAYLDAAWRVDPHPKPYRDFLAGLAAFSLAQFEHAIASLDKADPREFHPDLKHQRLFLLAAAHAHLGHTEQAASAKAELEALAKASGRELTGLRAIIILPFKQRDDMERLWTGLSKAGVPKFPFGYQSKDQLTGEEVRSLVFGHELRGRQIGTGDPYMRSTAPDGTAKLSIGSSSSTGVSQIVSDFLCTLWDSDIDTSCVAVFRNPGGAHERQNEYVAVAWQSRVEFSVMK